MSRREPARGREEIDPVLMRWCVSLALATLMAGIVLNISTGSHSCGPGEGGSALLGVGKGFSIAALVAAVVLAVLQQTRRLRVAPTRAAYAFLGLTGISTALALAVTAYLGTANDPMCAPF